MRFRTLGISIIFVFVFIILWHLGYRYYVLHSRTRTYAITSVSTDEVASTSTVKIACFNIAHGRGGVYGASNWQYKNVESLRKHLQALAEHIKRVNADILVLNEVDFQAKWSLDTNQAEFLAKAVGYKYVAELPTINVRFPWLSFRFGNAILSRYPLENIQAIDLPPYSKWEAFWVGNHDAVSAVVDTPSGKITVIGVHLEYRKESVRVQAVKKIAGYVNSPPVVIAGDFNSTPIGTSQAQQTLSGENAMTFLTEQQGFRYKIADNQSPFSFPAEHPDRLLDWILVKGNVSIQKSTIIPSALSDHYMVSSVLSRPIEPGAVESK
ncbi:MAG: endonuclease/exonuclease/phosphatase family protein [Spirochaetota bacterium]